MSNFYYNGRGDALTGLVANPMRYSPRNPQDYNDYMNGYNSVSKLERPNRSDILKVLELLKDERKK